MWQRELTEFFVELSEFGTGLSESLFQNSTLKISTVVCVENPLTSYRIVTRYARYATTLNPKAGPGLQK